MKISVFNDFSIFDAGKRANIQTIINKLDKIVESSVTIDFRNCLIDYPATSQLIDKILINLSEIEGEKFLIIKSDLTIDNELLVLNLLVWGSTFFDFSNITKSSNADDYKKKINNKLKEVNCKMQISLIKDDNTIFKNFTYG